MTGPTGSERTRWRSRIGKYLDHAPSIKSFLRRLFGRYVDRNLLDSGGRVPSQDKRKPKGWLGPEEDALTPDRILWQDPEQPIGHYYRWIWEYFAYLTLLCGITRTSRILEIGCHHGRTGRALLHFLRSPGEYHGFDVIEEQIAEATRIVTSRAPNFQYKHVDIFNPHYNPRGKIPASEFVFPYPEGFFDCVYAASVLTHLLPAETANYLRQTRRVLAPEGKALFSFFILDFYRGPGTTISPIYEFNHAYEGQNGVAVKFPEHPDAVIAYSREMIEALVRKAGLQVIRIVPGLWSNNPGTPVNEQDLVLLERA